MNQNYICADCQFMCWMKLSGYYKCTQGQPVYSNNVVVTLPNEPACDKLVNLNEQDCGDYHE